MHKKLLFLSLVLLVGNLKCAEVADAAPAAAPAATGRKNCCKMGDGAQLVTVVILTTVAFSVKDYDWFGNSEKFKAYPDYRPDLHPEHGDTCRIIPKSNRTMVCYNVPESTGDYNCCEYMFKSHFLRSLKTDGQRFWLDPVATKKQIPDLLRDFLDCTKQREFRYKPTTSHGHQKGGYRRKGDAR